MSETFTVPEVSSSRPARNTSPVAVAWIDWYPYHVARFRALSAHPDLAGRIAGLEMVGGTGVHSGLKFREAIPRDFRVTTLLPDGSWQTASKTKIARLVWKHLNQLDPVAVFVPGYYHAAGFACALWAKCHGRLAILMTETTEFDHSRVWWKERVKSFLLRTLFDRAIAGGTPHRRYLEKLGFRSERIAGCYDVVDNNFFRSTAANLRLRDSARQYGLPENYFLYVGRLADEKNIDGLLASYVEYRNAGGVWSLVLVGDGPEANRLRKIAGASRFARNIYFEGLKTSANLPPYYAFAGCFVLPSKREPWGLVVNEAMAAGLPVIVSNLCGCSEDLVEEGGNGFVFPPSSLAELTGCLRAIESLTPAARRLMGQRSAEIIERFTPEAWASEAAALVRSRL